jgi:hypothetical protein
LGEESTQSGWSNCEQEKQPELKLGKLCRQRRMSGCLLTLQVWVVLNLFIELMG